MLRRIKNIWKLSEYHPEVERTFDLASVNGQVINNGPILKTVLKKDELGDGKAVFLGEGTEEEFKHQQNEDKGIKGIFGL